MMTPPEFWWTPPDQPSLKARLLAPAAALVAAGGALRRWRTRPYRAPVPVICVGNLIVGGAGKTPTVRAVTARLISLGLRPHILSRGYGGRIKGPHRVDPGQDRAADVGDEPLMLAADAPVWIGADRGASAKAAIAAGADALVMDDGFQNPGLAKDLSLVVIDAAIGHGNGRVMPAGPLREPLRAGFRRMDAAVLIGDRPAGAPPLALSLPGATPLLRARIAPGLPEGTLMGRPLLAFAGIGRPEKFFATLRAMGAELYETAAFPDHHPYSAPLLTRLERRAGQIGAVLATTEKDAMRLPSAFRDRVITVPIRLGFEEGELLTTLLAKTLAEVEARLSAAARRR